MFFQCQFNISEDASSSYSSYLCTTDSNTSENSSTKADSFGDTISGFSTSSLLIEEESSTSSEGGDVLGYWKIDDNVLQTWLKESKEKIKIMYLKLQVFEDELSELSKLPIGDCDANCLERKIWLMKELKKIQVLLPEEEVRKQELLQDIEVSSKVY